MFYCLTQFQQYPDYQIPEPGRLDFRPSISAAQYSLHGANYSANCSRMWLTGARGPGTRAARNNRIITRQQIYRLLQILSTRTDRPYPALRRRL